jgi:tetratricopeptide (TPR) repeat protein
MSRIVAWFGIAIAAAWLVIIGGGWLGIYTNSLRIVTVAIAAILIAGWAAVAWRRPEWRPRSVLTPAILACLASMAISTAFSRVPRISLEYLGYAVLLAALYLLLVRLLANPFFRTRLVGLGTIFFVAITIEFVVIVVWLWIGWWQEVGRITIPPLRPHFVSLTYGNPSAVLTIVTLFAIPAAARWASWRPRGMLVFVGILAVVGIVALLSGSRAGWLALAVTGLVAIAALAANPERRSRARLLLLQTTSGKRGRVRQLALPVVAIVGVLLVAGFLPAILSRVSAGGEDLRTSFVIVAARIFAQSPIVGTGPGTWTIERIANTQPAETDYYIPHAHDVPAQTLAELGLLGALAGVVLVVYVVRLLRSAAGDEDAGRRRWAWLTGLGLLYFAMHQLLDFYPNVPAALFAAALPVAYLDATTDREPARLRIPIRLAKVATAAGLAAVAVACAGLLFQEIPAAQFTQAVTAADSGDWNSTLALARAAAASDPDIEPYQFTAGLAADRAGDHAGAAEYFQHVADRDDLPEAWLNLAAEQMALGKNGDASVSIGRALRLGAQRVEVLMPAGDLALRLGNVDQATQTFATAIATQPSLAADPWWTADPARAAIFPAILSGARAIADPARAAIFPAILSGARAIADTDTNWQIELMTGDVQNAGAIVTASSDPKFFGDVISAWTGDAAATDRLTARCAASPLDLGALSWCARISAHSGRAPDADRYRAEMDTVTAGSSVVAYELRVMTKPVVGPTIPGDAAWFWGIYTYRRAIPADMLVPSLVHLVAG